MRSNTRRFIAIVGIIGLGVMIPLKVALADSQSFKQLSAEWWQWALSIPASENPLLDTTGEDCMVGQRGDVWFLAGTFFGGTATRNCTIPEVTRLFFPVVNQSFFNSPNECGQDSTSFSVKEMRAIIAAIIDGVTTAEATVDGKPVKDIDRIQSKVFPVALPEENIIASLGVTCPAGIYSPTVDDGLYVQLVPLKVGEHILHIRAEIPSATFSLDVTYNLTVVPVVQK
jgi:hypothetical protein